MILLILGKKHSRCLFGTRPVLQCKINYEQYILMSILANLSLKKNRCLADKDIINITGEARGISSVRGSRLRRRVPTTSGVWL